MQAITHDNRLSISTNKEIYSMHKNFEKLVWKDPVCGMELSQKTAAEKLEHEGKIYYFCAEVCKTSFQENPEKYIKQHRQHGQQRQ